MKSLPKIWRPKVTTIIKAKNLKTLAMDEIMVSLKVHGQELMDEMQLPKGKIKAFKAS